MKGEKTLCVSLTLATVDFIAKVSSFTAVVAAGAAVAVENKQT